MTDLLLQIGLSNVCIALALAIVALVAETTIKRPQLSHLLWLLVFVKLVTPPVISIPVGTIGPLTDNTTVIIQDHPQPGIEENEVSTASNITAGETEISPFVKIWYQMRGYGKTCLPPIWLLGVIVVFTWSIVRIFRFNRLLKRGSEIAPEKLQTAAAAIATRLGLKSVPAIYTTTGAISPMVWWIGGKVRIVIPTVLLERMDGQQFKWVMAHELAHVHRRDYLVRWIEWLACVCFWWNPLVWWSRRHLRASEEVCCDALVVSTLQPVPHFYANSLLTAIEYLVRPVLRPPAIASEINSGGYLERRFKMIMSKNFQRKNARWLHVCVLLLAVVVLPLSMAYSRGSDYKTEAYFEQVWANLQAQVEAGNLDAEDAEIMMGAVKKKYADKANRAKYEAVTAKIRAAVEAGEMTPEEGREKLAAFKKSHGENKRKKVDWDAIKRRIEGAVESGTMTREEADAKYVEIKKRLSHGERDKGERGGGENLRARYAAAVEKIKAALEAGEITEKQAKEKFAELRKRIAAARGQHEKDVDWESIKRRIEGAVERGDMTREEADAKYVEIKKRLVRGDRDKDPRAKYRAVAAKIKAAVEAGEITAEEGRAKMAAYRKSLAE